MSNSRPSFANLRAELERSVLSATGLALGCIPLLGALAFFLLPHSAGATATSTTQIRLLAAVLISAAGFFAYWKARQGQRRLAAQIIIIGTTVLLLASPIALGIGIHGAGIPLLAASVLVAGFLLSPLRGIQAAVLFSAVTIAMAFAEALGGIPGPTPAIAPTLASMALSYLVLFLIVGWLTYRYSDLFGNAIKHLEHSREEVLAALESRNRSEAQYRLLLDTSPAGILQFDIGLHITYVNQRLCEIMQLPADAMLTLDLSRLNNTEVITAFEHTLQGNATNLEGEYQATFSRIHKWLSMKTAPLTDGEGHVIGGMAIIEDISARKDAETALLEARDAAEAANRAKSSFLATMSHELRTPLNGMLGMAQMLLMRDVSDQERQDHARIILNSGQTLLTLVNDLLDLSKAEAGKLTLSPSIFDPSQIISETASLFSETAHLKGLEISFDWQGSNAHFRADPIRLRQILDNLVNNAIKFSSQERIQIRGQERESTHTRQRILYFEVQDEGIGIPAEHQPLLFKAFSQVDTSSTRAFEGTGLGLSIVRTLAELLGGTAGVNSKVGQGSCFWFTIIGEIVSPGEDCRANAR